MFEVAVLRFLVDSFFSSRFVLRIPWTWVFIVACVLLRIAEGAGTAMFYTGTFATFPKLFPKSVSLLMVRDQFTSCK